MYNISDEEFLNIVNEKEMSIQLADNGKSLLLLFEASERFTKIGDSKESFNQAWRLVDEEGYLGNKSIVFEFAIDLYQGAPDILVNRYSGNKISIELATFLVILEKILQRPDDYRKFTDVEGSQMLSDMIKKHIEKHEDNEETLETIKFKSNDHIRYKHEEDVSGHNRGCNRGIKIDKKSDNKYIVSIHNLDGVHPAWGDNIQMAPKKMKIIRDEPREVEMRGFGTDSMGGNFSDYGITVKLKEKKQDISEGKVESITLHMHDRNVDIKYIKS